MWLDVEYITYDRNYSKPRFFVQTLLEMNFNHEKGHAQRRGRFDSVQLYSPHLSRTAYEIDFPMFPSRFTKID
jgi:hypothetical protein